MGFVLDASVALSWVFPEEPPESKWQILSRLEEDSCLVPAIWPLEVANALLVALRTGRIERTKVAANGELLRSLPIVVDDAQPEAFTVLLPLAERHGLSVYDASYLHLALEGGVALATADSRLAAAARAVGVELLGS